MGVAAHLAHLLIAADDVRLPVAPWIALLSSAITIHNDDDDDSDDAIGRTLPWAAAALALILLADHADRPSIDAAASVAAQCLAAASRASTCANSASPSADASSTRASLAALLWWPAAYAESRGSRPAHALLLACAAALHAPTPDCALADCFAPCSTSSDYAWLAHSALGRLGLHLAAQHLSVSPSSPRIKSRTRWCMLLLAPMARLWLRSCCRLPSPLSAECCRNELEACRAAVRCAPPPPNPPGELVLLPAWTAALALLPLAPQSLVAPVLMDMPGMLFAGHAAARDAAAAVLQVAELGGMRGVAVRALARLASSHTAALPAAFHALSTTITALPSCLTATAADEWLVACGIALECDLAPLSLGVHAASLVGCARNLLAAVRPSKTSASVAPTLWARAYAAAAAISTLAEGALMRAIDLASVWHSLLPDLQTWAGHPACVAAVCRLCETVVDLGYASRLLMPSADAVTADLMDGRLPAFALPTPPLPSGLTLAAVSEQLTLSLTALEYVWRAALDAPSKEALEHACRALARFPPVTHALLFAHVRARGRSPAFSLGVSQLGALSDLLPRPTVSAALARVLCRVQHFASGTGAAVESVVAAFAANLLQTELNTASRRFVVSGDLGALGDGTSVGCGLFARSTVCTVSSDGPAGPWPEDGSKDPGQEPGAQPDWIVRRDAMAVAAVSARVLHTAGTSSEARTSAGHLWYAVGRARALLSSAGQQPTGQLIVLLRAISETVAVSTRDWLERVVWVHAWSVGMGALSKRSSGSADAELVSKLLESALSPGTAIGIRENLAMAAAAALRQGHLELGELTGTLEKMLAAADSAATERERGLLLVCLAQGACGAQRYLQTDVGKSRGEASVGSGIVERLSAAVVRAERAVGSRPGSSDPVGSFMSGVAAAALWEGGFLGAAGARELLERAPRDRAGEAWRVGWLLRSAITGLGRVDDGLVASVAAEAERGRLDLVHCASVWNLLQATRGSLGWDTVGAATRARVEVCVTAACQAAFVKHGEPLSLVMLTVCGAVREMWMSDESQSVSCRLSLPGEPDVVGVYRAAGERASELALAAWLFGAREVVEALGDGAGNACAQLCVGLLAEASLDEGDARQGMQWGGRKHRGKGSGTTANAVEAESLPETMVLHALLSRGSRTVTALCLEQVERLPPLDLRAMWSREPVGQAEARAIAKHTRSKWIWTADGAVGAEVLAVAEHWAGLCERHALTAAEVGEAVGRVSDPALVNRAVETALAALARAEESGQKAAASVVSEGLAGLLRKSGERAWSWKVCKLIAERPEDMGSLPGWMAAHVALARGRVDVFVRVLSATGSVWTAHGVPVYWVRLSLCACGCRSRPEALPPLFPRLALSCRVCPFSRGGPVQGELRQAARSIAAGRARASVLLDALSLALLEAGAAELVLRACAGLVLEWTGGPVVGDEEWLDWLPNAQRDFALRVMADGGETAGRLSARWVPLESALPRGSRAQRAAALCATALLEARPA
jgi:hypothetical protein